MLKDTAKDLMTMALNNELDHQKSPKHIFEYKYEDYEEWPNPEKLNYEGKQGWEVIQVEKYLVDKGDTTLTINNHEVRVLVLFKRQVY